MKIKVEIPMLFEVLGIRHPKVNPYRIDRITLRKLVKGIPVKGIPPLKCWIGCGEKTIRSLIELLG